MAPAYASSPAGSVAERARNVVPFATRTEVRGMPLTRQELVDMVQSLPDAIEAEELIHRIYLKEKLARAEEDLAAGRVLTHEAMKDRIASWRA